MSTQRNDAPESLFFARDLEYQESKVYETQYPAIKFRDIFPVNNEGGEAVSSIAFKIYDRSGIAKVLSDYATDWPLVDESAQQNRVPVKSVGDAAQYSEDEVNAANKSGLQLDAMKSSHMREAYERKADRVASEGDPSGLMGWNTNPYIPVATPTTSSGPGDDTWPNKTADEILADLKLMEQTILSNTQGSAVATTLVLSPSRAQYLRTARLSNTAGTLLSYVKDAMPNIEIMEWQRMATASGAGAERASMFQRTPDVVEFKEPMPFKLYALEKIPGSLIYKRLGRGKIGGVVVRFPLACVHLDNI